MKTIFRKVSSENKNIDSGRIKCLCLKSRHCISSKKFLCILLIFFTFFSVLYLSACTASLESVSKDNSSLTYNDFFDSKCDNFEIGITVYPKCFFLGETTYIRTNDVTDYKEFLSQLPNKEKVLIGYICQNEEALELLKALDDSLLYALSYDLYTYGETKALPIYSFSNDFELKYLLVGSSNQLYIKNTQSDYYEN